MTSEPLQTDNLPPIDPTPSTSSEFSSSPEASPTINSNELEELLSDEAPLLAFLSEDLALWDDPEKAKAFVAKLQQARQSPQTFKSLLGVESDQLEKRKPSGRKKITEEERKALLLAKLMQDLA